MNAKAIKMLRTKAHQFSQDRNLSEAEEKRAYSELKKMYLESSPEERRRMGLCQNQKPKLS